MNFNQSVGSQTVPKMFKQRLNPEFVQAIRKNEAKGDFISLISRGPDDLELVNRFEMHWQKNVDRKDPGQNSTSLETNPKFKVLRMDLLDGSSGKELNGGRFPSKRVLMNNTDLLRSDHAAFWFSNHRDYYASFKAVHVSDTGNMFFTFRVCFSDRARPFISNY